MEFERVAKLGAEVSGIELSPDLPQDVIDEIEQGLLEHRVLFFRNQDLNGEELVDFSRRFGESFVQPALAHKYRELLFLENDKSKPPALNTFHQDMTGLSQPPALHMLQALVVPDGGGDTMWACNYSAYESLSDEMKRILGSLTCTHTILGYYEPIVRNWEDSEGKAEGIQGNIPAGFSSAGQNPPANRPQVAVRQPLLHRSHRTVSRPQESENLLEFLYQHIESPEFCVRLRWRVPALWRSGTTAAHRITRWPTTGRNAARCSALRSPATPPSDPRNEGVPPSRGANQAA